MLKIILKRAFALWHGRKHMPSEMRVYYYFNLTLLLVLLLILLVFVLPTGDRTVAGRPTTYGVSLLSVLPLLGTAIAALTYTCDSLIWKRKGSRTAFFLSTTSSIFLLGNVLTLIGSLAGLIFSLTRVRRYLFFDPAVDEYFGVSTGAQRSEREDA